MRYGSGLVALALAVGCTATPAPSEPNSDDFSALATLGERSNAFVQRVKMVGSLDMGSTAEVRYTSAPRYRAFTLSGTQGDRITIWITSPTGGEPMAWLLDSTFRVLASDDKTGAYTPGTALIDATLPPGAAKSFYLLLRDQYLERHTFNVQMYGKRSPNFFACEVDADCVAVPEVGCCNTGSKVAVNANQVDAYSTSYTCPQTNPICAQFYMNDRRQPLCNAVKKTCELLAIDQIICGGNSPNPHSCPSGYVCNTAGPDLPGSCANEPNAPCGGCPADQYCATCSGHFTCLPNDLGC